MIATNLVGCTGISSDPTVKVTIQAKNQFEDEAWLEIKPLHYKYSPKQRWKLAKGSSVDLETSVNLPEDRWLVLRIGSVDYDLPRIPSGHLHIEVDALQSPPIQSIQVNNEPLKDYLRWLKDDARLIEQIKNLRNSDQPQRYDEIIRLSRLRYDQAASAFSGSELEHIAHKLLGEYYLARLQAIRERPDPRTATAEALRQAIVLDARKNNFFTIDVLRAQRAGSRDFTHAYAQSFGFDLELKKALGTSIPDYDLQRLAYSSLDSARRSVAALIKDPHAKAYTEMHLVAERLGDASFALAEPSYKAWQRAYAESYPEWATFLQEHYRAIKKVTPGQPAIPFTLQDTEGRAIRMDSLKGRYVLLDFWANWCAPCLDEFPAMRSLYQTYSRSDFEIVAISLDLDRDYWLRRNQVHQNPWIQVWGGKQFEQETFMAYRGGGIPFYILIDREGKILRYNDIRPSFGLANVLDSLINTR